MARPPITVDFCATSRGAKLSAEDKKAKEDAEKTLAAEDSKGKPPEEAKTADGKPIHVTGARKESNTGAGT